MFATFPGEVFVFQQRLPLTWISGLFTGVYHWSIGVGGLAYLGLGLGFLISALIGAKLSDKVYLHVSSKFVLHAFFGLRSLAGSRKRGERNARDEDPNTYIWFFLHSNWIAVGDPLEVEASPYTLFSWYGWSAQARIHWIMPLIGTCIFGFALMTS